MKIRIVGAFVGLTISFALPTFAQQEEPTPSDENRQVSPALVKQGEDSWNNNDAAAVAAMFTAGYSAIDSREGDTWKLRMLTFNVTPGGRACTTK